MIYYVEDDANIRELVVYALNTTGMEAKGFTEAKSFWKAVAEARPELILLDIMLSGQDGMDILKKLKTFPETKEIPVIMLTAKTTEYDKVQGLDSGADDYVAKPFGMMELISRIKAVLRRTQKTVDKTRYEIKNLCMDVKKHEVYVDGEKITLTLKEFELLRRLIENTEVVCSRDQLLEEIWGYDFGGETRTIDVHVRTLRQKLGSAGELIETVRGVGYRIGVTNGKEN